MLSNSPGNIGFEAAPFKLPFEYVEVLGGVEGEPLKEFRRLFGEGFEAARKHCDRIITMVELMQKGEQDEQIDIRRRRDNHLNVVEMCRLDDAMFRRLRRPDGCSAAGKVSTSPHALARRRARRPAH